MTYVRPCHPDKPFLSDYQNVGLVTQAFYVLIFLTIFRSGWRGGQKTPPPPPSAKKLLRRFCWTASISHCRNNQGSLFGHNWWVGAAVFFLQKTIEKHKKLYAIVVLVIYRTIKMLDYLNLNVRVQVKYRLIDMLDHKDISHCQTFCAGLAKCQTKALYVLTSLTLHSFFL